MNRNTYVDRIYLERSPDSDKGRLGDYAPQGTERAITLGTILASTCSEDFLERLIRHLGAVDEFGGQIYISGIRDRFGFDGNRVEHREPGQYQTVGYVMHYGHRSTVKGQVHEIDAPLADAETPAPPAEEESANGVPAPEPVEA